MKRSKLLAFCLSALLLLTLPLTAAAATTKTDTPEVYAANLLYQLGLFRGVGENDDDSIDFELGRAPNREEAVTMLVRLLGKDAEAQKGSYKIPFTDVSDWAKPYVGYAYTKQLTNGLDATHFGGTETVSTTQYLTFVLRALGYDSKSDFQWDSAWTLTDTLGITYGEYNAKSTKFTRGDAAKVSAGALAAPIKNASQTLLAYLKEAGALAKSNLVIMGLEVVACQEDKMSFAFFPISGSPNTYKSFRLNRVTVNGLPCTIQQFESQKAAQTSLPALKDLYPDSFNYSLLSYDEAAAKEAAVENFTMGEQNFLILVFSFEGVGTLADGTTFYETFSEAVYIDGYSQEKSE